MKWFAWLMLIILLLIIDGITALPPVVYSVNCGGPDILDSVGIVYKADTLKDGVSTDYGARHGFRDVPPRDQALYQTERYSLDSFSYTIELPLNDADYTIVFRFSEVYFDRPGQKVFSVLLNGKPIINQLDIFKSAGGIGRPYDHYFSFKVQDENLLVADVVLDFDGRMELTFAKGGLDNPKCNAFAVLQGLDAEVPRTPRVTPPMVEEDEVEDDDTPNLSSLRRHNHDPAPDDGSAEKFASGPRAHNPYEDQDPWESMWPLLVVVPCLLPVIFMLWKMT